MCVNSISFIFITMQPQHMTLATLALQLYSNVGTTIKVKGGRREGVKGRRCDVVLTLYAVPIFSARFSLIGEHSCLLAFA